MKIAIVCMPHYRHTNRLILDQFGQLPHQFFIFELGKLLADLTRETDSPNITWVPIEQLALAPLNQRIQELGIDRILSFSDRGLQLAAQARQTIGLPGNNAETEQAVVNKGIMRNKLTAAGLSKIQYTITSLKELATSAAARPLPFIVKPTSLTGSLCVERIDTRHQITRYIERCNQNAVFDKGELILEDVVPGQEYSVEGMIIGGRINFLGISERHSQAPYYVGNGHDFYTNHPQKHDMYVLAENAIRCLEMDNCPFHIEMRAAAQGFEVIEVHTRFAGLVITDLIEHATGIRPFKYYIESLLQGDYLPMPAPKAEIFGVYMMMAEAGTIEELALDIPTEDSGNIISQVIDRKRGDSLQPNISPTHPVGYVLFHARDRDMAKAIRTRLTENYRIVLTP